MAVHGSTARQNRRYIQRSEQSYFVSLQAEIISTTAFIVNETCITKVTDMELGRRLVHMGYKKKTTCFGINKVGLMNRKDHLNNTKTTCFGSGVGSVTLIKRYTLTNRLLIRQLERIVQLY